MSVNAELSCGLMSRRLIKGHSRTLAPRGAGYRWSAIRWRPRRCRITSVTLPPSSQGTTKNQTAMPTASASERSTVAGTASKTTPAAPKTIVVVTRARQPHRRATTEPRATPAHGRPHRTRSASSHHTQSREASGVRCRNAVTLCLFEASHGLIAPFISRKPHPSTARPPTRRALAV
jgi:hypothetical protein